MYADNETAPYVNLHGCCVCHSVLFNFCLFAAAYFGLLLAVCLILGAAAQLNLV